MADPTQQQIQAWLDEALAARHRIIIYGQRTEVRQRDRSIVYGKNDIAQLDAYIAELRGMLDGAPAPTSALFTMTQTGTGYE